MDAAVHRQVLRAFTYGLYAVGVRQGPADGGTANVFLANWLTQVSFDPPLVGLSVERDAWSLPVIEATGLFTVNVLASGRRELAGRLGKSRRKVGDKLAGVAWRPGPASGAPVLHADAVACAECRVRSTHPAGDSVLVVAEVVAAEALVEGEPLTMAETGFRHAG